MLMPRDLEDILDLVRERVPDKQECQLKSFGLEDKEFLEDCYESTELLRKLIEPFIESSILLLRVTNSKTKLS